MGAYELMALDMDGTALTTDKRLLDSTVRALEAAAARGRTVALCTGRCVPELAPYRDELASVRYAVTVSGAVVYDRWEERTLYAAGIERPRVLEILALAEKYDAMAHLLAEDASILRADQAARAGDYGMEPFQALYRTVCRLTEDLRVQAAARPAVPKVNIYFRTVRDRDRALTQAERLPLTVIPTEPAGLEFSPPGVTKATGLARLAALLHIPMEAVAAVGDGDNDVPMLAAAGLAVAVGNAVPAALAAADAVVADNDHDGAGQAIWKYLLE